MSLESKILIWIVSDADEDFDTQVRNTLRKNLPLHSYMASSYSRYGDYQNNLRENKPNLIITNGKCKGHYGEKSYDFKPYHMNWVNPLTWFIYIDYFAKQKILNKLRRK